MINHSLHSMFDAIYIRSDSHKMHKLHNWIANPQSLRYSNRLERFTKKDRNNHNTKCKPHAIFVKQILHFSTSLYQFIVVQVFELHFSYQKIKTTQHIWTHGECINSYSQIVDFNRSWCSKSLWLCGLNNWNWHKICVAFCKKRNWNIQVIRFLQIVWFQPLHFLSKPF